MRKRRGAGRPPGSEAQLTLAPPPAPVGRRAWTGPFQPALEAAWLATLRRLREADPLASVWLVVPSRFLGHHLTRLAARAGGVANLHVLTFTDLADRLLPAAAGRPRLPPVGDVLVLRQAVREAVPADGYFAAVRDARRFPAVLAATLAELRTAGVRPDDLEVAAADAPGSASARKLVEVARIARQAEAALVQSGFSHPTEALWAAAASAAGSATLAGCAALAVYGFTDWNAAERALLAAVAPRVPTFCFVPAETGLAFEALAPLSSWLEGQGFEIEHATVAPADDGPRALAARLFEEPRPPGAGAAGLEVVAAPGEEREVREIARRLLAAAADGIPFEAMGILVRHPDSYRTAIRDVFDAAGIPYTWGVAPRLGETRAGRSVRLLLAARREDFARAAVIDFLATANLREGEGVEPAEWDRLSREAGIVGGRADWRRGLGWLAWRTREEPPATPAAEDDEGRVRPPQPPATAVQALGRVVGALLDVTSALPEAGSAAVLGRGLLRALLRLCHRDEETLQVAGLLATFETLARLSTPLALDEFAELLDAALAAPAAPEPEARQGRVFVAELHQALGLPFRLVVIPGLVEQGFPGPPRADPILLDHERARLWAQVAGGRPGLALPAWRLAEERLAFRLAAAAADERLLLTYPRVDAASGRARVPSFFLLRVAEAVTGRRYDFTRLEAEFPPHVRVSLLPAPPGAMAAPIDRREWLVGQAARAREAGTAGRAACLALMPRAARGRAALEAREQGEHVGAWDGLLPPDLLATLAAHHRTGEGAIAATPLETYATCPFRYYLGHVLRVAPPVEPERLLTLAPADRGRFLHAALARAYAAFREAGLLPLTPARLPAARACVEAAFAETEAAFGPTGLLPFWRGERARLLADVLAAIEAEAHETEGGEAWVPTDFEVGFGGEDPASTVDYTCESGRRLAFRGRLDRLDLSADGTRARVVDYKAGRAGSGARAKLAGGTALQLPVYRLAAEALCRARGQAARIDWAEYYFLTRRGGRRRRRFTEADWAARRGDFERAVEAVLDGIGRGRFFQNPSAETCRVCDYQPACGPERERIAWVARKLGDPAREPYARLQEIE